MEIQAGHQESVWTNPGRESTDLIPGTPTNKRQSRCKYCFDRLRNLVSPSFSTKTKELSVFKQI